MNSTIFFSGLTMIVIEIIAVIAFFADWSLFTPELLTSIIFGLVLVAFNFAAFMLMIKGASE